MHHYELRFSGEVTAGEREPVFYLDGTRDETQEDVAPLSLIN